MSLDSIKIDSSVLKEKAKEATVISSAVQDVYYDVYKVKSSLSSKVLNRSSISSTFTSVLSDIIEENAALDGISNFLTAAASAYEDTEDELTFLSNTLDAESESDADFFSNLNKIIGKYGTVGSVVSAFLNPFATWADTGELSFWDWSSSSVLGASSAVVAITKDYYKYLYEDKSLWGLDDIIVGSSIGSTFTSSLSNQFSAYTSGGMDSVFAYGGAVLTLTGNVIGNQEEYASGEISASRAVAETVVETAVDIGVGMVVKSAVTATVGAAAVALGAPAIVSVAVVAAATIGVNAILDYAVGEDFTEWASDKIIDGAITLATNAVEGASVAVEAVSSAVSAVSDAASSAWSGFKSLFG